MKKTIRDLAKFLQLSEATLYHKKKTRPKEWCLLWNGWCGHIDSLKSEK